MNTINSKEDGGTLSGTEDEFMVETIPNKIPLILPEN